MKPGISQDTEDKSLSEQVQGVLQEDAHVRGYKLSVLELPHAIVIGGTVSSYYHKQVAQEAVIKFLKPKLEKGLRLMLKNEIVVGEPKKADPR